MLAALELVHMNARIYDPALGRFLSADSIIQFEGDLQSYNRYSYVLNNPLKYTDPSGNFIHILAPYIAAAIFEVSISSTFMVVATIVSATIHGAITGGFEGAVQALVMTISSMALSNAIGGAFDTWNAANAEGIRKFNFKELARAFTHGIAQGAIAEGMGGEFRSGFAGGFAGSIAGSLQEAGFGRKYLGTPGDRENKVQFTARTVAAAVVGGTVSEISGGKFANGAAAAAMVHVFNTEDPKKGAETPEKEIETVTEIIKEESPELWHSRWTDVQKGGFTLDSGPGLQVEWGTAEYIWKVKVTYGVYKVDRIGWWIFSFGRKGELLRTFTKIQHRYTYRSINTAILPFPPSGVTWTDLHDIPVPKPAKPTSWYRQKRRYDYNSKLNRLTIIVERDRYKP